MVGNMSTSRSWPTNIVLRKGKVLTTDRQNDTSQMLNIAALYDPVTNESYDIVAQQKRQY